MIRDDTSTPGWLAARTLDRSGAFWTSALVLGVVMAGSSLVSPLYDVYQAEWHFSSITLTAVFAVYAASLLAVLLLAGALSDRVGRRPMMAAAMVAEAAAAGAFLSAHGVGALYAGRLLQGVATGAGIGAVGAALVDFQPPDRPSLAGTVNAGASMGALAVGALGAGALVQYGPAPTHLVFWLLLAVSVIGAALVVAVPESVRTRRVALADLRPRLGIPAGTRSEFAVALPALIATWALGGLYFSLGPAIASQLSGSRSAVWGGLVIALLTGVGTVAALRSRSLPSQTAMLGGSAAHAAGAAVTLVAIATSSIGAFVAGSAVAGAGFGVAYLGALRHLLGLATEQQRGELVGSIYVVSYIAFSVPVVVAGAATTAAGLHTVAVVYAAVVLGAGVLSAAVQLVLRRRTDAAGA